MTGFEPVTSSLPRKRSTPELHRLVKKSERRDSNPRPSAWKADALSTELRQQMQKVAGISRQHRRLPCTLWRVSIALPDQGMGREQPCEHTGTIPGARHLPQFLTEHHDISTPPLQVASTLPGRLELPTLRLTASRSNQLS